MTTTAPRRVVLDTNVVIAAGSSWLANEPPEPTKPLQRLVHCVARRHVGLYCREILEEYAELLSRHRHPPERAAKYLAFITVLFTPVALASTQCHTPPADPDDLVFILCALDGDADLLVSDDNHLLKIRQAYLPRPDIVHPHEAIGTLPVA